MIANPSASSVASPERQGRALEDFTIMAYLSGAICLGAALLWHGEEPSKLHTLWATVGVHLAGVLAILCAKKFAWIGSPSLWLLAFGCKFALGLWLTQYFWFDPLAPDLLRVSLPVAGSQDSNLYDFYALEAARVGLPEGLPLLNFTWLSFGITGYLALIYTVLGVSIAYVSMCNSLLSIAGLIMLCASLRLLFNRKPIWDWIALAAYIPSIAFYDATPAKEPLTNFFFYLALYALVKLGQAPRFRPGLIAQVVVSLALLALVRANVALILLLANAWPLLRRIGLAKSALIGVAGAGAAIAMLILITGSADALVASVNVDERIQSTAGFVQEREDAGESGLKQAVAKTLAPRTPIHLVALSPLRAVIWFYLPYPLILPSFEDLNLTPPLLFIDRLGKISAAHELAFALTAWLLILATPALLEVASRIRNPAYPGFAVLFANIAVPALVIGNLMFIMGRRYRTLIEPLVLAVVLVALHFRLGRRISVPVWIVMVGGVCLTALLRS